MQQAYSSGPVPADPLVRELDGRCFERLPEAVRRRQRFGSADAAALAEALALGREIDRAAVQMGRRVALARPGSGVVRAMAVGASADPLAEPEDRDNWISLREAGLAVLASIAHLRAGAERASD